MTQEFIADDEILRVARHCLILRSMVMKLWRERRRMKDEDEEKVPRMKIYLQSISSFFSLAFVMLLFQQNNEYPFSK